MKFRRTTAATVIIHLRRYADFLESENSNAADRRAAAKALNGHLDDMNIDDAFGTEGQRDPRGDHRE